MELVKIENLTNNTFCSFKTLRDVRKRLFTLRCDSKQKVSKTLSLNKIFKMYRHCISLKYHLLGGCVLY